MLALIGNFSASNVLPANDDDDDNNYYNKDDGRVTNL